MKANTGSLAALVGVVLIGMTGFGVFLPIFPFLALDLGASPSATTISMGAYSLGQLVASPAWGRLSDRIGRKPVLIAGLVGGVISYLWLARAGSVIELGAARLFGGLMAGNVGAAFAAAADLADERTRARNMGLLGAAVGLGFIAGPALGGFLVNHEPSRPDFAHVCIVSAMLAGAAALTALFLFRESHPVSQRRPADAPRIRRVALLAGKPALARFVAIMFLMIAAQAMMETVFALWSEARFDWGPRQVAWTLAALGAGAVLLQGGGAGAASRVLGERVTLLIGLTLLIGGFGGLAVVGAPATMAAALVALVAGIGLATPALNSLIASAAGHDERGAVMGLSQSASALGRVAGPMAAGPLFEHLGVASPFVAGALVTGVALFVALGDAPQEVAATPQSS